jgi:hypothetical protein
MHAIASTLPGGEGDRLCRPFRMKNGADHICGNAAAASLIRGGDVKRQHWSAESSGFDYAVSRVVELRFRYIEATSQQPNHSADGSLPTSGYLWSLRAQDSRAAVLRIATATTAKAPVLSLFQSQLLLYME